MTFSNHAMGTLCLMFVGVWLVEIMGAVVFVMSRWSP